ncbi:hypothetical protein EMCG_05540 [[Emmonsia] crescens]|uniref:Mid2 domain-containing protein n=1 Tax=[Emmonsia] crescens TaxID=73230 RepID=A0A0G2HPH1_9EURO|nr:hypothetical protein EMCG_05540 [Emmonsia crescens UAMH 3008]
MRHPTFYILVISSWLCLFALSWASPVDISHSKFPPCRSPVKDVAGFSGKCVPVSRPTQQVGMLKFPNTEGQRRQLFGRKAPSQQSKMNRITPGINGRKHQFIEEEVPTRERDPFTFFPDIPDPTPTFFPGNPDSPHFTTTFTEDPFEGPTTRPPTTSIGIPTTDAPQTTSTPRNFIPISTSLPTQPPTNSNNSNSDAGPIIVGCSIGGIALVAILYLAFMAWRRSRNKKRKDELNVAPPPYANQPMGERGGPQTGFCVREATREIPPPTQSRTASWAHASNPASPPDSMLGQTKRQEHRVSRRFYAAFSPIYTDLNGSNDRSTRQLNLLNSQNPDTEAYTQTSNLSEPFTNLAIVTEESPQEHFPPAAPVARYESAAARAERQPTSYRSRRDSRDIVRRSLLGSTSSNNDNSSHEHGSTDYDWQHVSYQPPTNFGSHHDVSPIEPTDTHRLPYGRQKSPPLTIDPLQRRVSNIRPNSTVSVNNFESIDGPPSMDTKMP